MILGAATICSAQVLNPVTWLSRTHLFTGAITLAASYVIDKLKEKEWTDWLKAEPFRHSDSTRSPHCSESVMHGDLANAIADMN